MIEIFSDFNALEQICLLDDYPNWQKAIANQTEVYTNLNNDSLLKELTNSESSIFMFYHANAGASIPIALGNQFQFAEDHESILNYPYGFFILNVENDVEEKLSKTSGLEIYNSNNLIDLKDCNIEHDLLKDKIVTNQDQKDSGWKLLLDDFCQQNSNSSIIIDRNIFTNWQGEHNLGIENLKSYFATILPEESILPYEILIITELKGRLAEMGRRDDLINSFVDELQELRDYDIVIETLLVHASTSVYEFTHNRRIFKNYHFGESGHGFCMFCDASRNKVYRDNNFTLQNHFHSVMNGANNATSIARRNNLYKRLMDIKAEAEIKLDAHGQNDNYFRLYLNNEESLKINNRLLG